MKILGKFFLLLCGLSATILLSSCAKQYKPKPIVPFQGIVERKNGVEASARRLSRHDAEYHFCHDLAQEGYQAIQLSIRNPTNQTFVLTANNINLPLEPAKRVAKDLHYNTTGRAIGWGAASLLMWGLIFPPIAGVIDTARSYQSNKALDRDFAQRVIDDNTRIVVEPKSVLNKVMFVSLDQAHKQTCALKLIDNATHKSLSFNLAL